MKIEGLEDLTKTLTNSAEGFNEEAEKAVGRISNKIIRRVKSKTPVAEKDGGTLKRSWHVERPEQLVRVVYNDCEYAPHIEFGHRTRLGEGGESKNPKYKYKPKPGGIKLVEGRYMLTRSVEEVEKDLEDEFETMIENLWK
nr:MAG TPA: type I neck protein [Caudoviricetes sp.]